MNQHAQAFLQRLDAGADAFTFQTFDDTRARRFKLARVLHGKLEDLSDMLDKLQHERAGVFVTVAATDGAGRKAENIRRVRALFVDLDGAPLEPVLAANLKPHIVVESSPGRFHAYWLTHDCPLEAFKPTQRALAARFGGDPKVHDLPRVMRLPGTQHLKAEPQACRMLDIDTDAAPYALADIVGALGLQR